MALSAGDVADPSSSTTETCGAYVDARTQSSHLLCCPKCGGLACCACTQAVVDDGAFEHTCVPQSSTVVDRFEALERGRHHQIDLHRSIPMQLRDGCHHITCECGHHFCYICCEDYDGPQHFVPGSPTGCTKYNNPNNVVVHQFRTIPYNNVMAIAVSRVEE